MQPYIMQLMEAVQFVQRLFRIFVKIPYRMVKIEKNMPVFRISNVQLPMFYRNANLVQ